MFSPKKIIYPGEEEPDEDTFPFDRYQPVPRESRFTEAVRFLTGLLTEVYSVCRSRFAVKLDEDSMISMYPPGRLGFKVEGAGKVRVFAIPNALNESRHYFVSPMIGVCRS